MIVLIVARETELKDMVHGQFASRGGAVIHYRNPIKAMDNLEEIQPDVILFYTQDFPRHWKPFVRFYRSLKEKENGICVLFTGDLFTEDEAAKAQLLGVNGLIPFPQEEHLIQASLEEILQRYVVLDDGRRHRRYTPREFDNIAFMFSHPDTYAIVTGTIIDINIESVRFFPDTPDKTADIREDQPISGCSLQIDDDIYTFSSRLIRNNKAMTFLLEEVDDDCRSRLSDYFSRSAERALAAVE